MKKKGMVYNVTKQKDCDCYFVDSFKDGIAKAHNKQFGSIDELTYWITKVNMPAHCATTAQINISYSPK